MDSLASISGLATGIDFRELVDQIIELESSRLEYLRLQVSEDQAEQAAWREVETLLTAIETAGSTLGDGSGLDVFVTSVLGANPGVVSATANEFAVPGRHTVRVLQAAQRETFGSSTQTSKIDSLGLAGRFILDGSVVEVVADDSLLDIAGRVNALNSAATASVVGADGAYRLVLSAAETGEDGLGLRDLSGVLSSLGVFDGTVAIKNRTSGGFDSDAFSSVTSVIGTELGFTSGAPSGTVTLGAGASAFNVTLDLGTLTLEGARDAINAAAITAGASMFATIETTADGSRLAITGTATVVDDGGVLQALGVVEGGRGSVAHVVQGDVLTTDAGGTPASAATALTALFNGASSAGATVGDTILFEGTDDAGNAFSFTHTVTGGDTLQTLLTRLEGAEGFNGSATAEISVDGRLTISSTTPGASQLSLNAFAGNENGGILDLGEIGVTTEGRNRALALGADAIVEIDGTVIQRSSNEISDVVPGVTFDVLAADPLSTAEVVIEQDVESVVESTQAVVDALNAFTAFVAVRTGAVGENRPALSGNSTLRGILNQINFAMQTSVTVGGISGSLRLSDVGIEINREGSYDFDAAVLTQALEDDAQGVRRLFSSFGTTSSASLSYVGAGASTPAGTYDVVVSQLGATASVASVGFGGIYVDDGSADTITITDLATSATYDVALTNGATLAQLIDSLNAEFADEKTQQITSERTLYSDAGATAAATAGTVLSDLYHGAGQSSGFVTGSEITFSGTDANGSAVLSTFVVTDPATQTYGDVLSALQAAFGAGTSASISGGQIVVSDQDEGASTLSVSIGSDVPGNAAPLGPMQVTVQGRDAAAVVASAQGTELQLSSASAGASNGFAIAFTAGGSDGTASLGLGSGSFTGADVIGTIGGEAATGTGNILTADSGTTGAGLSVGVSGAVTGSLGSVTFTNGILSNVSAFVEQLLGTEEGSVDGIIKRLGEEVNRVEDRLFDREERLERRRLDLIDKFSALEVVIARAQSQQEYLTGLISNLPKASSSS